MRAFKYEVVSDSFVLTCEVWSFASVFPQRFERQMFCFLPNFLVGEEDVCDVLP